MPAIKPVEMPGRSGADFHVFGLEHSTWSLRRRRQGLNRENRPFVPNRNVSRLFRELEKRGGKRLGFEAVDDPRDIPLGEDGVSGARYARAVTLRARRHGIKLVDMEKSVYPTALAHIAGMLVCVYEGDRESVSKFADAFSRHPLLRRLNERLNQNRSPPERSSPPFTKPSKSSGPSTTRSTRAPKNSSFSRSAVITRST